MLIHTVFLHYNLQIQYVNTYQHLRISLFSTFMPLPKVFLSRPSAHHTKWAMRKHKRRAETLSSDWVPWHGKLTDARVWLTVHLSIWKHSVYIYICIHTYVSIYIYKHTYIYIYIIIYIIIYIYIYMYTHTHEC